MPIVEVGFKLDKDLKYYEEILRKQNAVYVEVLRHMIFIIHRAV